MLSLRSQNHVNGILLEILLVGGPPLHLKNTAAPFASPILFRKSFFPSLSPLVLGEVSVQNADTNRYLPPAPITTFWVRARVSTNWLRPTGKPTDHLVVFSVGRSVGLLCLLAAQFLRAQMSILIWTNTSAMREAG